MQILHWHFLIVKVVTPWSDFPFHAHHGYLQAKPVDEDDPLESFMAEMQEEAKAEKPSAAKQKPGLELDDDDNVADYMEVNIATLLPSSHPSITGLLT